MMAPLRGSRPASSRMECSKLWVRLRGYIQSDCPSTFNLSDFDFSSYKRMVDSPDWCLKRIPPREIGGTHHRLTTIWFWRPKQAGSHLSAEQGALRSETKSQMLVQMPSGSSNLSWISRVQNWSIYLHFRGRCNPMFHLYIRWWYNCNKVKQWQNRTSHFTIVRTLSNQTFVEIKLFSRNQGWAKFN